MTPRRLDAATVARRLAEIRRRCEQLDELLPVDAAALADWRTRGLVEHTFEQLVELAVAVNLHIAAASTEEAPEEYRSSFRAAADAGALPPELADRLAPAAGLRNLLVHDYLDLDLPRLANGVNQAPGDFRCYIRAVARWLAERTGTPLEDPSGP